MVVDEHDAALHDALPQQVQLDLGAVARARHDGRPAAGALEPALDRLDEPATVGRHGGAVEAGAAVAHEDRDLLVGDLGVDVDLLDARELGRVRHRLARCQHDGADGRVDRAVARARELDAHAVELLDVARCRRERRHERGVLVADRLVVVQPAAELALLPARQRRHAARLGLHAAGSAPASAAPSRAPARRRRSARRCGSGRCARRRGRARAATPRGRRSAAARPRLRRARAAPRRRRRSRAAPLRRPQRARCRRRRAVHRARKLPPWRHASARPAAIRAIPTTDRSERPRALSRRPPATRASTAATQRRALAGVRPQRQVEHDPRAAGEREQRKDEPDEGDVDRKGLRDTRADPRDHPLVRARGEGGQRHAGSS